LTILSQHTSDRNCEQAFAGLRERFGDWEAVADAPEDEIAVAIRVGGMGRLKAPRIKAILRQVQEERGAMSLDHLAARPAEETRRWLTRLRGVGPKTAACVQLFSLGQPAMPVDTHVLRVSRRVGLVGRLATAEHAQQELEARLGCDRDRVYALHLNLIAHGRAICRARRPLCPRCPLRSCCDAYREFTSDHADREATPPPSDVR
jgi:endonuclease-3